MKSHLVCESMNHFFAYLSRMKLIERWSLMRSTQKENVQEHSQQVAVIAHALAVIKNKYYGGKMNEERVALLSLYHDATEVLTGDLPTPVKYFNPEIRNTYKAIEKFAAEQLLQSLPKDLRANYQPLLMEQTEDQEIWSLIKAADKICAYIKCLEEKTAGNPEFAAAEKTLLQTIQSLATPEVDHFMKIFVPSFSKNIDEMSGEINL
jgi:5'-deoxynucleotidase